ncbi:response regulator transcription factor [Litoribrevibacter albus]|uniref:DNA-binding response regulator n=1 Tax=Litoribrevibacter albus TaxID=1473156 RepID=A0AA37W7N7_9GAMM|nr:response regulator transcription factor [Litoribrevibacter albus]GLQ31588.1 DNA-binding response regulator [Litoribrevibacter albus]
MTNILLVDDDITLNELLANYLSNQGFDVESAYNGKEALAKLSSFKPELMVLDIMMPIMDGLDTLKEVRKSSELPVLMLTAKTEDIDRIIGLEMGADDYLAKPCNPRELVARIKAILRRSQSVIKEQADQTTNASSENLTMAGLSINPARYEAYYHDNLIQLTGAEFKLLQVFMSSPGRILSKEQLTLDVLNRPLEMYDRAIDVHVSNLRKKLAREDLPSDLIANIRGQGYLFKEELLSDSTL